MARRPSNTVRTLVICLALAAAPAAQAQSPGKALATREQYSACLDSADEARARQSALQKRRADHEAASQQLQADLKTHLEARETIKAGSRLAETWNATSESLNARSTAQNAEANAIEKDIAEHNRLSSEARARCSNLQVTPEDREAVTAARQEKP